ncbi:acetoin utilization deacetylase AcuC-like enzyme [Rhizomicrobium palustre]|uniref:Acetoin utilization deacetylase AcuC-like enzyme n=1 Tax=Rhizomicrobium palustre TaxID=189966 RepID=A0A846MW15_9PROT|nr:histone deacetylase family protein [Rhizomicrobium palustre]NIK87230.1 acetoin utilization deacetylase AcuC-like enzyme [Rhizomicrobium palustre]
MKTFYSPAHLEHDPQVQFEAGQLLPAVEVPMRAETVRVAIEEHKLGPILPPTPFSDEHILAVHDAGLVSFLGVAWHDWTERYGKNAPVAIPSAWPAKGLPEKRKGDIEARLGTYAFSADAPIMGGTWPAAREAVNVALSAAEVIRQGEKSAFALTRPPGHHAASDVFGGFCYLNNAAIAAQYLIKAGIRPAVLDVDYHHGNGTQSIFYQRSDVFFCSIHADPNFAYPHFLGFADERGEGDGEGYNLNMPLPNGTDWERYDESMKFAMGAIKHMGPDVLILSMGLDTYIEDPIAGFRLKCDDYLKMGQRIASLGKPVLFMFEGGYCFGALGQLAVNVLEGFHNA